MMNAKRISLRLWRAATTSLLAVMAIGYAGMARVEALDCRGVEGSCVVPIGSNLPRATEEEAVLEIQCRLGCLQQNHLNVEVSQDYPAWPNFRFSQLESNCGNYQKFQECHSGCSTRSKQPSLTTNRCRDMCYSNCQSTCNGQTSCDQPETSCHRKCRKTYCRFGCALYSTLTDTGGGDSQALSSPVSAPTLTPVNLRSSSSSSPALFAVNLTAAAPQILQSPAPQPIVGYVFRIEDVNTDAVGYISMPDLESPLDLSGFSCRQVSVSFRVVSAGNRSEYSPATELCIEGVRGFAGQVDTDSIAVSYSEDTRPGYLGYAVAQITWERPPGHEYLSSYKITLTSHDQDCGGADTQHVFAGISRNTTSFTVSADSPIGLMRFSCSYILTILALPAQQSEDGTHKSIAPSLLSDPPPTLDLQCSRVWEPSGHFSILASWTISSSALLVEAIKRFTLYPVLKDTTQWGPFAILERFPYQTAQPRDGQFQYSMSLDSFIPHREFEFSYVIELRTDQKEEFFWRRIPLTQSCTVDSSPIPPLPLTNISVNASRATTDGSQRHLQLSLLWQPPGIVYGDLRQYELRVGSRAVNDEGLISDSSRLHSEYFPAMTTSADINMAFNLTDNTRCLYLQMRAYNEFVASNWSMPVVLALDDACDRPTPHSNATGRGRNSSSIKIYLETSNGSVQVLELKCDDRGGPVSVNSPGVDTKLQHIEEKLRYIEEIQVSNEGQLSSIDTRIASLEEKLTQLEILLQSRLGS